MKIKYLLLLIFIFSSLSLSSEPLSYYQQFFSKTVDLTHDPDFPVSGKAYAVADPYDVVMTGTNKAVGVFLSFNLREDGRYSFWYFPVKHRWKNGGRQIKLGKCHAFNGRWEHKDGSLYLGKQMKLDPIFKEGRNLLTPTFLKLSPPREARNLTLYIERTADNDFGVDITKEGDFDCKGFFFPFWLPIPNER